MIFNPLMVEFCIFYSLFSLRFCIVPSLIHLFEVFDISNCERSRVKNSLKRY